MQKKLDMKQFHNIYSVSKTLRFELKPLVANNKDELIELEEINLNNTREFIGKYRVSGHIEEIRVNNIETFINADEKKAKAYREVKLYLNELHREFIAKVFANFELQKEDLEKAYEEFCNIQNEGNKEAFENIQKMLYGKIKNYLNTCDGQKDLFGKKIITLLKDKFKSNEEAMNIISEFDKFTTYFGGYNQSRKNMYNEKIPERLINDNLSKHYENVKNYQKIKGLLPNEIRQLNRDFQINADMLFSAIYFNKTMSQSGIDKYNEIIGGRSEKEGQKTKGLNEYINEYNSINRKEKIHLPKFQQLYKQILSEVKSNSFRYRELKDKNELIEEIDTYYGELNQKVLSTKILVKLFENLASHNYNLDNIYIHMPYINSISNRVFGRWDYIVSEIKNKFSDNKNMKKTIKALDAEDNESKNKKSISLGLLQKALLKNDFTELVKYFAEMKAPKRKAINKEFPCNQSKNTNDQNQSLNLFEGISEAYKEYLKNKEGITNIKALLDAIKDLQNFVRVFIPNETVDTDAAFYNVLREQYAILRKIISLYNKARNLATQKPYSLEKFKLNFNCPTLLNGWDVNKEQDNLSILLKKDGFYYLGIISPQHKKDAFKELKKEVPKTEVSENCYEKMEYKLLPGANKMLPKVFLSKKGIKEFHPSTDLLEKYEGGCHKKGDSFDIAFLL